MKTKFLLFLLLLTSMIFWYSNTFANPYYIRSFRAFLMEEPTHGSKKLTQMERGTAVEKISEKGLWTQIKVNTQKGWVSKMVLSPTQPKAPISLLAQETDIAENARRRASSYSSTAAARGLVESGRTRIHAHQLANYEALEILEQQHIAEQEATQFISFSEEP